MLEITSRPIFGITLCLITYAAALRIKSRINSPIANPMLIASLFVIAILYCFKIPLENFMNGGSFITMLLAPATAVLALPMYRQLEVIKKNLLPVIIGCCVGAASSLISVVLLCKLFNIPEDIATSLLPKSITNAIATELCSKLGGIVPLTVAAVCFTGVFGAVMCPYFIKWFRVDNPVAAGLAIGASCHALGTSKALEIGEVEGMMSGISIGLCGLFTVFFVILFG